MKTTPNHRQDHATTELEELSEYELMERDFEAIAAKKGLTPGSALWQLERRSYYFETDLPVGPVELAAGPRPIWADPDSDIVSQYGDGGLISSSPWSLRLNLHPGQLIGDHRRSATARLKLMQKVTEIDPIVVVDRYAEQEGTDGISRVPGSTYRLTLDEAVEWAHLLLLAVDVARGTNDDIDQAVA